MDKQLVTWWLESEHAHACSTDTIAEVNALVMVMLVCMRTPVQS